MLPRFIVPMFAIGLLAGCIPFPALDRPYISSFQPAENGAVFRARANHTYPEDSERAERMRRRWLDETMQTNQLCPNGYEVAKRQVVAVPHALGTLYDIYYHARCAA